jgi:hypothetical protein
MVAHVSFPQGTFMNNKVNGRAKQELSKDGESFEGHFVDGTRDGEGSYTFANGTKYNPL